MIPYEAYGNLVAYKKTCIDIESLTRNATIKRLFDVIATINYSTLTKYSIVDLFSELKISLKEKLQSEKKKNFCQTKFLSSGNKFVTACFPTKKCMKKL